VVAAARAGLDRVAVPAQNAAEARLVPGVHVVGLSSLRGLLARLRGAEDPDPVEDSVRGEAAGHAGSAPVAAEKDLADVVGQATARWALELAAAGGHHLFLLGPPGAGKTMLAERLPGLLPDLDDEEALEVTAVHSVAGTLRPGQPLVRRPPYQAPHHSATMPAVVGGGSGLPRPGAASVAHRGVLFLDEAPEFAPRVLDALREPLESAEIVLMRAGGTARYPARFRLVLAANPCPCGLAYGKGDECTCASMAKRRYLARLSGPLLDRIDLHLWLDPITDGRLIRECGAAESTAVVAERVRVAQERAAHRYAGTGWRCNAEPPGADLRRRWAAPVDAVALLESSLSRGTVSMRGADRVLRVAWTIADLAGRASPGKEEVDMALHLRRRGGVAA
jgi:magnesium chelatase family protein